MSEQQWDGTVGRLRNFSADDLVPDIAGNRQDIHDFRDDDIRAMCERYGYGAVMDSAARQWRRKDPIGAFTVGTCVGLARQHAKDLEALPALLDVVEAFAASDPMDWGMKQNRCPVCRICGAAIQSLDDHLPRCKWVAARRLCGMDGDA